jgi:hypothetical protein
MTSLKNETQLQKNTSRRYDLSKSIHSVDKKNVFFLMCKFKVILGGGKSFFQMILTIVVNAEMQRGATNPKIGAVQKYIRGKKIYK